jgi:Malectin domain
MASAPTVRDRKDGFCEERAELQAVLSSPLFQRAPKLSKILAYICEKYFSGKGANLKEYSIAVDALGRAPGFDPQADAIVRVDLHLLRKRLELYYAGEGKSRRLRILLPLGHYVPEFVLNNARGADNARIPPKAVFSSSPVIARPLLPLEEFARVAQNAPVELTPESRKRKPIVTRRVVLHRVAAWVRRRAVVLAAICCGVLGVACGIAGTMVLHRQLFSGSWVFSNSPTPVRLASAEILQHFSIGGPPDFENRAIRIHCGSDHDYVDSAGFRWSSDRFFSGGSAFQHSVVPISRSTDPILYSTGRMGSFHYDVPVSAGVHEVRLLFAETAQDIEDGMRETSFIVGSGMPNMIDVVSDAGGTRTATTKVYSNVRPGADGKIHITFQSTGGFLNAIEILPEITGKPGPIRISTLPHMFVDLAGRHWFPDRYFLGGRNIDHVFAPDRMDPLLFSRERFGNFSYSIPVAQGYSYQLTLYMAERYWGPKNSGNGGVGSRIFDVRCGDVDLLRHFDLLGSAKDSPVVAVRFHHLHPDSTGKLDLQFLPVVNYAILNALEVEAE